MATVNPTTQDEMAIPGYQDTRRPVNRGSDQGAVDGPNVNDLLSQSSDGSTTPDEGDEGQNAIGYPSPEEQSQLRNPNPTFTYTERTNTPEF